MVRSSTRVPILAFADIQRLVLAPVVRVTAILRAFVTVIAGCLVHHPVAVVVNAIARFQRGHRCITRGQPLLLAETQALTGAELVGHRAWGMELQGDGLLGAGTTPSLGHTLPTREAVGIGPLLADKPPGASDRLLAFRVTALPPAKAADCPVFQAAVCDANGITIVAVGAGLTQVGEVGYTDVDNVRSSCRHLLTRPAVGAFLEAGLSADPLAQMLNAPTGLTLGVAAARVEETTFASLALGRGDKGIGDDFDVGVARLSGILAMNFHTVQREDDIDNGQDIDNIRDVIRIWSRRRRGICGAS